MVLNSNIYLLWFSWFDSTDFMSFMLPIDIIQAICVAWRAPSWLKWPLDLTSRSLFKGCPLTFEAATTGSKATETAMNCEGEAGIQLLKVWQPFHFTCPICPYDLLMHFSGFHPSQSMAKWVLSTSHWMKLFALPSLPTLYNHREV